MLYLFCVLSCLNLRIYSECFQDYLHSVIICKLIPRFNLITLLIRIGYLGYISDSFYLVYRNYIELDFLHLHSVKIIFQSYYECTCVYSVIYVID